MENLLDIATDNDLIKLFLGNVSDQDEETLNETIEYIKESYRLTDDEKRKGALVDFYIMKGKKEKALELFKTINDACISKSLAQSFIDAGIDITNVELSVPPK